MVFASEKNKMVRGKLARLLNAVVLATIAGGTAAPYGFLAEKDADMLTKADGTLVEVNKTVREGGVADGKVAVHATQLGVAANVELQAEIAALKAATPATPVATPTFTIESGIPVAPSKRSGATTVYPFDSLAVGQSFFVPVTEAKPTPWKSLNSTVSSATRRYKDSDKRKFVIRETDSPSKGARIWRSA